MNNWPWGAAASVDVAVAIVYAKQSITLPFFPLRQEHLDVALVTNMTSLVASSPCSQHEHSLTALPHAPTTRGRPGNAWKRDGQAAAVALRTDDVRVPSPPACWGSAAYAYHLVALGHLLPCSPPPPCVHPRSGFLGNCREPCTCDSFLRHDGPRDIAACRTIKFILCPERIFF